MWEPTRQRNGEGRRCLDVNSHWRSVERRVQQSHRGSDDGMSERGNDGQHGKPLTVRMREAQPELREEGVRAVRGGGEARSSDETG